jgi:hypothetical protein
MLGPGVTFYTLFAVLAVCVLTGVRAQIARPFHKERLIGATGFHLIVATFMVVSDNGTAVQQTVVESMSRHTLELTHSLWHLPVQLLPTYHFAATVLKPPGDAVYFDVMRLTAGFVGNVLETAEIAGGNASRVDL